MTDVCELIALLSHAQHVVSRELEEALKAHNLSVAKYNILKAIQDGGGRLPFSVIVEQLGCVRSNVTGLIDRLQEDQLVRRADHPEDKRMLYAELTEQGYALLAAAIPAYDAVTSRLFDPLDVTQRSELAELLQQLAR